VPTSTPTAPLAALVAPPEIPTAPESVPFQVSIVVEPPGALEALADLDQTRMKLLLGETLAQRSTGLAGLASASGQLTWSASSARVSELGLRWPRRLEVADGVYLDLVAATVNGRSVDALAAQPAAEPFEAVLILTPAYRLQVVSPWGEPFGSGIYRHGSIATAGLLEREVRPLNALGLLGGWNRFLGWQGFADDQSALIMTGPRELRARWREDLTLPAVLGAAVAVLTLLCRPIVIDWSTIKLTGKVPWPGG
jgi:hypothetical protein